MKPLIISAPFGNYRFIQRFSDLCTPTYGTFTAMPRGFLDKPRGGRFLRVLMSVRYSRACKSWINKIGLKNPGIDNIRLPSIDDNRIISIFGWKPGEWNHMINVLSSVSNRFEAIEINAGCPNVDKPPFELSLFQQLKQLHLNVIVKLPPVNYIAIAEMAYSSGVRCFHATNTLPTPRGGLSGKALMPVALDVVKYLRRVYPDTKIIGGGGVTCVDDALRFVEVGASHVAVGSMLFNPLNWLKIDKIARAVDQQIGDV